jgi:hypothetical protein
MYKCREGRCRSYDMFSVSERGEKEEGVSGRTSERGTGLACGKKWRYARQRVVEGGTAPAEAMAYGPCLQAAPMHRLPRPIGRLHSTQWSDKSTPYRHTAAYTHRSDESCNPLTCRNTGTSVLGLCIFFFFTMGTWMDALVMVVVLLLLIEL